MENLLNKEAQHEVARIIGDAAITVLAEKRPLSRDALMQVILGEFNQEPNIARDIALHLLER
ncbi:hypothetical protein K5Y32_07030 [Pantoea sp. DY-15]|uniref:hypothetical protein n=1 Tax=Pantoea sp. DY-15 TaxID=2871489 RepID=UPI001C952CB7|nr:hypothetical protein [Pantoea sp. DY-15]MBY4887684.1 hypothetical protein [Pantoea sp. DY-15]